MFGTVNKNRRCKPPAKAKRRVFLERLEDRRLLTAVNIPTDLEGFPGFSTSVPVIIDDTNGLESVEVKIDYDTILLDTSAAQVTVGSVWGTGTVIANVNDAAGTIILTVFDPVPLGPGTGSVVDIEFDISGAAVPGTTVFNAAHQYC